MLDLCSFLAPDDIRFELFADSKGDLPPALSNIVGDKLAFNRALKALRRYSLIKSDDESLSIHRLVQVVVRDRLKDQGKDWAKIAVNLLDGFFRFDQADLNNWNKGHWLLPHILIAAGYAENLKIAPEATSTILNEASLFLENSADFLGAKAQLERALILAEKAYDLNHANVATMANNLGNVLKALGDLPGG